MKGTKFNFDKFLYFKHLETLYTQVLFRLFLILFLTSLWLSQDKGNSIEQEFQFTLQSLQFTLFPTTFASTGQWGRVRNIDTTFTNVFWNMLHNRFLSH